MYIYIYISIQYAHARAHTRTHTHTHTHIYIYIYRELRGNVPDFGRLFLKLQYTDLTKNTYIRS